MTVQSPPVGRRRNDHRRADGMVYAHCWLTDPSNRPRNPPRPRDPTTTATGLLWRLRRASLAGGPSSTTSVHFTPRRPAQATASWSNVRVLDSSERIAAAQCGGKGELVSVRQPIGVKRDHVFVAPRGFLERPLEARPRPGSSRRRRPRWRSTRYPAPPSARRTIASGLGVWCGALLGSPIRATGRETRRGHATRRRGARPPEPPPTRSVRNRTLDNLLFSHPRCARPVQPRSQCPVAQVLRSLLEELRDQESATLRSRAMLGGNCHAPRSGGCCQTWSAVTSNTPKMTFLQ